MYNSGNLVQVAVYAFSKLVAFCRWGLETLYAYCLALKTFLCARVLIARLSVSWAHADHVVPSSAKSDYIQFPNIVPVSHGHGESFVCMSDLLVGRISHAMLRFKRPHAKAGIDNAIDEQVVHKES